VPTLAAGSGPVGKPRAKRPRTNGTNGLPAPANDERPTPSPSAD
jgi:hypothetical protein